MSLARCACLSSFAVATAIALATPAEAQGLPKGSYLKSCDKARLTTFAKGEPPALVARCGKRGGGHHKSVLRLVQGCAGDIHNHDGTLRCRRRHAPKGSYKRSCPAILVKGAVLHAVCYSRGGGHRYYSKLAHRKCHGDIRNNQGWLDCLKQPTAGAPKGSYRTTCRDISFNGVSLKARCRKKRKSPSDIPGYQWTTLKNANACRSDISNQNGRLTCGRGATQTAKRPKAPVFRVNCPTGPAWIATNRLTPTSLPRVGAAVRAPTSIGRLMYRCPGFSNSKSYRQFSGCEKLGGLVTQEIHVRRERSKLVVQCVAYPRW